MPEADYIDDGDDMLDEAVIRGLERLQSDEDADAKAELPMPPSEANDGDVQVTGRLRKVRIGVAKHEGPGTHPGTGTEQEVHAGDSAESSGDDDGGLPDGFQQDMERVREWEREAGKTLGENERGVIVVDGESLEREGDEFAVTWDEEAIDMLEKWDGVSKILSHTHPVDITLSTGDLDMAIKYRMNEIRAVTTDKIYRMRLSDDISPPRAAQFEETMASRALKMERRVMDETRPGDLDMPEELTAAHWVAVAVAEPTHEMWEQAAEDFPDIILDYEVVDRNG